MSQSDPTNPLIIGCSGGGGHNAAARAIAENLEKKPQLYSPDYNERMARIRDNPQGDRDNC